MASVLVGLASFALYLWLAPPVSGDRDSSELTLVLALDGIAHPTGYPLWTLFGHAFAALIHALGGSWPYAANAWSAMGGGVAMALVHALAARLFPRGAAPGTLERVLLPLLPVALLLLNPAWVQVTTVAEVYSWHQAWALGVALTFVSWVSRDAPAGGRDAWRAAGWGLLCGAGLAHHATSVVFAVPLTIALVIALRPDRGRAFTWMAVASAAALVPLASLLVMRMKMASGGPAQWMALENSWPGFFAHVTGGQYRGLLGRFAPEPMDRQLIVRDVLPFLVAGLVAFAFVWRATPRGRVRFALASLLAVALLQTAFAFGYGVEDPSTYFLPALALALVAVSPALAALPRTVRVAAAAAVLLVALATGGPWLRSATGMRATWIGLDGFVHEQWERITVERGLVLWPRDMHQRLIEYQRLRGEKPALDVMNPRALVNPAVRRRFFARYGFDPIGDLRLSRADLSAGGADSRGSQAFVMRVAQRINERTELPVIVFAPEVPAVLMLPKPASR